MIPYIFLFVGGLIALFFLWMLIKTCTDYKSIHDRQIFNDKSELDVSNNSYSVKYLLSTCTRDALMIIGGVIICSIGYYLGFTDHGEGFLLFDKNDKQETMEIQKNDRIAENGKYLDTENNQYSYCIRVEQDKIFLNEDPYDIATLKEKIEKIGPNSRILLIDYYAISSTYHDVEDIINACGLECHEESW